MKLKLKLDEAISMATKTNEVNLLQSFLICKDLDVMIAASDNKAMPINLLKDMFFNFNELLGKEDNDCFKNAPSYPGLFDSIQKDRVLESAIQKRYQTKWSNSLASKDKVFYSGLISESKQCLNNLTFMSCEFTKILIKRVKELELSIIENSELSVDAREYIYYTEVISYIEHINTDKSLDSMFIEYKNMNKESYEIEIDYSDELERLSKTRVPDLSIEISDEDIEAVFGK